MDLMTFQMDLVGIFFFVEKKKKKNPMLFDVNNKLVKGEKIGILVII